LQLCLQDETVLGTQWTIISTCETIISNGSNVRVTVYFTSLFFPSVYVKATDKYFSQRKLRATSVNAPAKDVNYKFSLENRTRFIIAAAVSVCA